MGKGELLFLLQGLKWTVVLAAVSFLCGTVTGLAIALLRVRQVQQMVFREPWMQCDVEETFLSRRVHTRHARDRATLQNPVVHAPQCAAAFRDQEIAIGQERQAPGMRKTVEQRMDVDFVVFGLKVPRIAVGPARAPCGHVRPSRRCDSKSHDRGRRYGNYGEQDSPGHRRELGRLLYRKVPRTF